MRTTHSRSTEMINILQGSKIKSMLFFLWIVLMSLFKAYSSVEVKMPVTCFYTLLSTKVLGLLWSVNQDFEKQVYGLSRY